MSDEAKSASKPRRWIGPVVFLLVVGLIVLVGLLGWSILERRWESQRPPLVLKPIGEWETDNAKWGENYPHEWDTYKDARDDTTRTKFGGADPRDYLEEMPNLVILFAGYGFSKDYLQARGHWYAVEDVAKTARIKQPVMAGTCWTCKSPDVPRMMHEKGVKEFYATSFQDLQKDMKHPIGCLDCHDPKTMNLRISRPALQEAYEAMGKDIDDAGHQEMRSLVCAQCHVEYYFKNDKAAGLTNYLTFPWSQGDSVEGMIEYYDALDFQDFVHPISKVRVVKAQHPDFELFKTGIHHYRGVSCVDCHMPYRTEGGVKFTDHHVRSPLLNIANSCGVCHRWSEKEIQDRVESIQTKVATGRSAAEKAVIQAHFDIAAATEAGVGDDALAPVRKLVRHAQFRWDYVAASNGMGFHSPQEAMRILLDATNQAQQARLAVARLLGAKGIFAEPAYPDWSSKAKATAIKDAFLAKKPIKLLAK